MTREEAVEFARQLEGAVNAHDTERILGWYRPDAVMVSPVFGESTGREAIAASWHAVFSAYPDWTVRVADVLADGDRIAFLGRAAATDCNGWFGQPPTGQRIEYRALILLRVVAGKIVREERIYDLSNMLERLEKVRLQKELDLAADVQRALLARTRHVTPYGEAVGDSLPCRAIGGDFFEILDLPSGKLGVALGDVAGKGPAAALLAAMLQGMFVVEAQAEYGPAEVLARLNRALARRRLEPRFATLVYGVIAPDGLLTYSIAGHNPPLLLTAGRVRRLTTGGPILAAFDDSRFQEEAIQLSPDDTIIMFSDGVTEARDARDQEFGEERLIACAEALGKGPAADMLSGLLRSVREFGRDAAPADDITVTLVRFHGAGPERGFRRG